MCKGRHIFPQPPPAIAITITMNITITSTSTITITIQEEHPDRISVLDGAGGDQGRPV